MTRTTFPPRSFAETVRITLRDNGLYLAVFALLLLFPHIIGWITGDSPFGVRNRPVGQSIYWQGVMIEVFILVTLTISYNLMFGFSGVVSFGHALFFGLGGYTMGIVIEKAGIESPELALFLGFGAGTLLAGFIGFLMGLASLRLHGVYFAIFSLAIAEMAAIWVQRWAFTRAEDGFALANIPDVFNATRNRLFVYYFALSVVVFTFLFIRRLIFSPTGHVLLAVRENEDRARTIGYNTLTYKLLAITIASIMAAGAGMVHAVFNKKVGPEIMSVNYTIDPLLMTIIGGTGTFTGPVIGAAGLTLSERIFNREFEFGDLKVNIGQNWSLILGLIFIVVVLIFPQGIVGTINRWRAERKPKIPSPPPQAQASPAGD